MRLLLISNQGANDQQPGFAEAYEQMVKRHELSSFAQVFPRVAEARAGHRASLEELERAAAEAQPDVLLVATPNGFGHDRTWVRSYLRSCGDPVVLCLEGDPWGGRGKRVNESMSAWLEHSTIVFSVAREPHSSIFREAGARDVRFMPHTYCQVIFREAERTAPPRHGIEVDVVMIGSRLARWGLISRLPGAVQRARLGRSLQRSRGLRTALYGTGWSGPAARGVLPFADQPQAIRRALISVNWDHFPRHESYASDRLPISMLAGRVHVTTRHPHMDWVPGEESGLFLEDSPRAVADRIEALTAADPAEVLDRGARAHEWARGRMSHAQAARFMLGAMDSSLMAALPEDPWAALSSEWRT